MKTAPILIAAGAALMIALPAAAQPKAESSSCFWTRDLRNHTVGGDHILYFDVGGRSVYRVDTSDNCLSGATSSDPIVLIGRGNSGQICTKMDLNISVRGARCIVSDMTKLSPAEAAALPRKLKP
jgi:hypothetical protein